MNGMSVLIPVYQVDPSDLVKELHRQLTAADISFEILVFDDSSDKLFFDHWSLRIQSLANVYIERLTSNTGRAGIRNKLVTQAVYPWVLFLDADTYPCSKEYIQQLLPFLNTGFGLISGGTAYRKNLTDSSQSLRWKYGRVREEHTAAFRSVQPYEHFTLNNLLILKEVIVRFSLDDSIRTYGHEDTLLGMILKQQQIKIRHIDNFVYHDGLDTNTVFLQKTVQAVHTLAMLYVAEKLPAKTKLICLYDTIHSCHLSFVIFWLIRPFEGLLRHNLTGKYPSLFFLDGYKIYHFIKEMQRLGKKSL